MKQFDYKIQNIQKFALTSFYNFKSREFENALNNARKTCEAICRAVILKHFGETQGLEIIEGKKGRNGNPKTPDPRTGNFSIPLLASLIGLVEGLTGVPREVLSRMKDIKEKGNPASHDTFSDLDLLTEPDAYFCMQQLTKVLEWVYSGYLNKTIPLEILDAFKGNIDEALIVEDGNEGWNNLFNECEYFNDYQGYILISPPKIKNLNLSQLSEIAKIPWSTVFDFNPDSQENGLYKAVADNVVIQDVRPLTILQKDEHNLSSASKFIINWVFSNGLRSIPSTISKDKRDWKLVLKYGSFIQKVVKEIFTQKVRKYVVLCLWNDVHYLREIIEKISEVCSPSNVKYVFIVDDQENFPKLQDEFNWIDPVFIHATLFDIIKGIQSSLLKKNSLKTGLKQVPGRAPDDSNILIDITNKHISFLEIDIEVLYLGIELELGVETDIQSFFKGNLIRWDELSKEIDARRDRSESLLHEVRNCANLSKGAYVVEFYHKPGGGGTTVARRIAFEFHKEYPTVIISKFHREKTNELIFQLSDLAKKPILAIIEAHDVNKNELNQIIRKINEDKKHVIILYVKRVFKNPSHEAGKQVFLNDVLLNVGERERFIGKYEQIAPLASKVLIQNFRIKTPNSCEIVDFSLTAFEEEYSKTTLTNYINRYLGKLPVNQFQFAGFASIVYYYTQKNVSSNIFYKLFPDGSLEHELSLRPIDEHYIRKLFIQNYNTATLEYEDSWRPRYHRFATEIIRLTLSGDDNWKDYLSKWSIDMIELLKSDSPVLTDDVWDLLKSLFLDRDHEDFLGVDEEYQYITNKKFSRIIDHIADKVQQVSVLKKLVDTYPDEAHFRGHLGRYLYENAREPQEFVLAEAEITKALELGELDFNLWHLKGMCNRRRVEFLIRYFDPSNYSSDELNDYEYIIKCLTENAIDDFAKSREINPMNLHSHTAQIQLSLRVIEFGQKISNVTLDVFFIESANYWYENLVNNIFELIDEAKYIIELTRDLDYLKERSKAKNMISGSEGKLFSVLGDFSKAVDRFMQLSNSAERQIRPYYRKMYVYSILNSKSKNNPIWYDKAWEKLSDYEFENVIGMLESNIREQPEHSHNMKLWFRAIRGSGRAYSIDDCLSVIRTWYDNTAENNVAHLEASYYRYILHASKAIEGGQGFSLIDVDEARRFINESKELAENDRFSFEWYSTGKGIKCLVNHSLLGAMNSETGFFADSSKSKLGVVEGVITNIFNRQQGRIRLECGLDAFFVPAKGSFERGAETKKVKFYISFRYSGLHAWEVVPLGDTVLRHTASSEKEIESYTHEEELAIEKETTELLVISERPKPIEEKEVFANTPKLEGPTIVGKIDLSQFDKYKKKHTHP